MDSAHFDARNRKIWFLRELIDAAMESASEDDFINPQKLFDRPGPHPMSTRLARAVERAGFMLRTDGKMVKAGGIRRRLQLEDVLDPILVWAGFKMLKHARYNSQARDRLATAIYDSFHRQRLVLVRIKTPRTGGE